MEGGESREKVEETDSKTVSFLLLYALVSYCYVLTVSIVTLVPKFH